MPSPKPAETRQQRKKATFERLVSSAHEQFRERGIGVTRVTDIAKAASVAHGTAFSHFPNREKLVSTVISRYAGQIALRLHDLIAKNPDLETVLNAHVKGLSEDEAFYARLVAETPMLSADARSTVTGIQSAIASHISTAYRRGVAERRFRKLPESFVFNLWIGMIHHYLVNRDLFSPKGSVLQEHGASLVRQFVTLLSEIPKGKTK